MAGTITVVNLSKKQGAGAVTRMKATDTPVSNFLLIDCQDGFDIQGVDANNNPIDLFNLVTLPLVSADPTTVAVIPNSIGNTRTKIALLKTGGPVNLTSQLTYVNGGAGPFTVTIPLTVYGNPANELRYGIGTVTIA